MSPSTCAGRITFTDDLTAKVYDPQIYDTRSDALNALIAREMAAQIPQVKMPLAARRALDKYIAAGCSCHWESTKGEQLGLTRARAAIRKELYA